MIKKLSIFLLIIFIYQSFNVNAGSSINENLFQEAINKNFAPIDEKAENYLRNLNSSKNYCFGPEKKMNFTECVDQIEKVFSINSDELVMGEGGYAKACKEALIDTINMQENKIIPANQVGVVLDTEYGSKSCAGLYAFKLAIFKSVAYDILKKNKYAILKDEHKKYTQKNRKKFDNLLTLIRVNLGNIERLWKKWPSKTKK